MAEDPEKLKVNLQPPKLFGRRRRKDADPEPPVEAQPEQPADVEPEPVVAQPEPVYVEPEPTPVVVAEPEPVYVEPEPTPVVVAEPEPEPVVAEPEPVVVAEPEPERREPPTALFVDETTAAEPDDGPTDVLPVAPSPATEKRQRRRLPGLTVPTRPRRRPGGGSSRPRPIAEPGTTPEPVLAATTTTPAAESTAPARAVVAVDEPDLARSAESTGSVEPAEPIEPAERRVLLPGLAGWQAAALCGAVVGLLGVLLVVVTLRGCEAARGTATCGGGPGFLLLVAITLAMVLVGAAALSRVGVVDATSTSVLGVALVAVIAVTFLVDVLMSWTMVLVIPAITAGTFVLSWWVTTAVSDEPGD